MIMGVLFLLTLGTAVWAVRSRSRARASAVPGHLLWAGLALLVTRLSAEAAGVTALGSISPALRALGVLSGFVCWTQLVWLAAYELTRRGLIVRTVFAAFAVMLALARAPVGVVAGFTIPALWHFRWRTALDTGQLFRTALGALALMLLLFVDLSPAVPATALSALLRDLANYRLWATIAGGGVAALAVFKCAAAFGKDPSLGIRTVSRRLALSHTLVVLIPLLITVGLWAMTTYLGVGADRAAVAARIFDAEAEQVQFALRSTLTAPGDSSLVAYGRAQAARWPGVSAYQVTFGNVRRVFGTAALSESLLHRWASAPDSIRDHGALQLGRDRYLGAIARRGDRAAVLLAPIRVVLDSTVSLAAGARLDTRSRAVDDSIATAVADSITAGAVAHLDSLAASAMAPEDSAQLRNLRRVARGIGLPESSVTVTRQRSSPGLSISTGNERIPVEVGDDERERGGFPGRARFAGVRISNAELANDLFGFSASVPFRATLLGLFMNLRDNPLNFIPLGILLGMVLMVLPVAVFNFGLVRNMGSGVADALGALRGGTAALGKGDLGYRIEVKGRDDLWDASRAFNQMAEGLEHARELEKERERLESELEVARRIQARLLPSRPPEVEGLEIAGLSESAREVGGDYYDHIPLGEDRVLLVIADVSGKGVPAALLMSAFRASLMSQDTDHSGPAEVASRLNEFLHRSVEPGKFVTAFVGFLEGRTGRFVYANAGHNPPALLRADGRVEWLSAGGLILGILAGSRFESGEVTLEPGDLLALYTDGVTEGADSVGELWGEERLVATLERLRERPCQELASSLVREVRSFEGETGPADDITVLLARRSGTPGA